MPVALSLVIPCLDEAAIIAQSLARLQSLRQRGVEVIVVDGGSSDGTRELATPLADRVMQGPRGRANQMNAGAAAAQGDVLLFLHADCSLPPDADIVVCEQLAAGSRRWGRFDVELDGRKPILKVIAFMMNLRSRLTGIATGDQGIFIKRSLFQEIGGFPALPLMEDIALSKLARRTGPPLCLPERIVTSARRWERQGVLRTILLMWRLRLAYFFGADAAGLALRYERIRARD